VIVALDTNILIWGIKSKHSRRGNPRQPNLVDLQRRSAILLDILDQNKDRIVIPTITVAELLIGVKPAAHVEFITELQERFFCPSFDIRACAVAADLWLRHKELPKSEQLQRAILSSDVKIIATAKVAGAEVIYSHEPKFRRLASTIIRAEDLPVRHPDMFRDAEFQAAYPGS
jgi:predicted nucleic acid-binding protein